jgi:hypothetical protein
MTWLPPYLGGILGTRLKISEPWVSDSERNPRWSKEYNFLSNVGDGSQYVDTFVALKKLGACTSLKTAESLFYTLIQRFKNKIFFKVLRKFYE